MLKASNITRKINDRSILENIDLEIQPGTITSIIGPSGSGKTTLLKALSMLDLPQSGNISLDNLDYKFPMDPQNITSPWPKISVVFQQLFIWPHLTLRENIELPLKIRGILRDSKNYLEELYLMFNMQGFIDRFPNEASGGQRQRVALVRALALRPKYLLLDEITSSLDVEQSEIILSHLTTIKQKGVGIVMVAHDINFAISHADNVCFMDNGKIIKTGKPYEFLLESKNKRIIDFISNASLVGISSVKIYSGVEEFQAYHMALLNRLPENSTITIIGGLGDSWYIPMGERYKEYDALRIKKTIVWNMLMYEYGGEDRRLVKEHPDINNLYIISESMKTNGDININSDGTVLLQIIDPTPTIIEIKNRVLADSYIHYYNDLVKHSKKFTA
jgi:ABC-type polar amino acid transport system ATPase subunit